MADAKKPLNKSQLTALVAEKTGLSKSQVTHVMGALGELAHQELGKKGPGLFVVPGMVKLSVTIKAASPAGTRANPFKPGEMMEVKARPARNVVKARVLKVLKDAV